MTKKELAEALEELRNQPEIGKKMKQETPEDVPAFWAEVLTEKGYNVSSGEISSFIREAEEERRQKTADKIAELPDQELEAVAGGGEVIGGKGHQDCQDTYRDRENCWYEDGCDNVFQQYDDYDCLRQNRCTVTHR